jgi:hypothetical protein
LLEQPRCVPRAKSLFTESRAQIVFLFDIVLPCKRGETVGVQVTSIVCLLRRSLARSGSTDEWFAVGSICESRVRGVEAVRPRTRAAQATARTTFAASERPLIL